MRSVKIAYAVLALVLVVSLASAGSKFSTSPPATSGTNTGDVTLGAVGSTPSANGASLSGQVLTLQPASVTQPGLVSAGPGVQVFNGPKTFDDPVIFSNTCAMPDLYTDSIRANTGWPIKVQPGVTLSASTQVMGWYIDASGTLTSAVYADGMHKQAGVVTGDLQVCDAGLEGAQQYDKTTHRQVVCNGTAWKTVTFD